MSVIASFPSVSRRRSQLWGCSLPWKLLHRAVRCLFPVKSHSVCFQSAPSLSDPKGNPPCEAVRPAMLWIQVPQPPQQPRCSPRRVWWHRGQFSSRQGRGSCVNEGDTDEVSEDVVTRMFRLDRRPRLRERQTPSALPRGCVAYGSSTELSSREKTVSCFDIFFLRVNRILIQGHCRAGGHLGP